MNIRKPTNRNPSSSFTFTFIFAFLLASFAEAGSLTAKIAAKHAVRGTDNWYGCERTVFDFEGYEAWVVEPPAGVKVADGNPWTWTMQWATAYVPRTSVPRLVCERGWRHATVVTFKDKMDAHGLAVSARFQRYLVDELGFAPKAALIGMSWGGFFSVRYAAHYPENVARIYLDCPYLVLKDGVRPGTWAETAPADGNWRNDPRMPINLTEKIAAAKIPVLLLYGGEDQTLPPGDNAEAFIPRFEKAGGLLQYIKRPFYGHHPHGVEINENTIIDFFTAHATPSQQIAEGLDRLRAEVTAGDRLEIIHHRPNGAERDWLSAKVPECVAIAFTLRTSESSAVNCRVLLPPPHRWTRRFWGVGNQDIGKDMRPWLFDDWAVPRLKADCAVAIADMGTADGRHGDETLKDFGWRAMHALTVEAKRLVQAFYGRPAAHSYFLGISSGGGQGFHEAQRFPDDYDGIVAYVPAFCRTELMTIGRDKYRAAGATGEARGFMNKVLNGPDAPSEYLMDDAAFAAFKARIASEVDAVSTDLDAFAARGGKLLVVSGLVDKLVDSATARRYCEALAARYGQAKLETFFRCYFLPGRGHCNAETPEGVNDIPAVAAIVDWIEKGRAPASLDGTCGNGSICPVKPWTSRSLPVSDASKRNESR